MFHCPAITSNEINIFLHFSSLISTIGRYIVHRCKKLKKKTRNESLLCIITDFECYLYNSLRGLNNRPQKVPSSPERRLCRKRKTEKKIFFFVRQSPISLCRLKQQKLFCTKKMYQKLFRFLVKKNRMNRYVALPIS